MAQGSSKFTARRPALPHGPLVSLAYKVAPERREELLAMLTDAFPFYERPGGMRMGLYESRDEPGVFLEVAAYASEADHSADEKRLETPEYKEVLGRWHALIEGELQVMRLRPVELRGEAELAEAPVTDVERLWKERWGVPILTLGRSYTPEAVQGLGAYSKKGELRGLVTWSREGAEAELVSMDALDPGRGVGSRLLVAAETRLRAEGVRSFRSVTTNDNLSSAGFFQKHGYRLAAVHPDAVARIRALKPAIPEIGRFGIPLRDLWELRKDA